MQTAADEICRLKYRYLRTLDLKEWDDFADCLAEDIDAKYGEQLAFTGRDAVVDYMRSALGNVEKPIITLHQCHHPEIDVDADGNTAIGTWYLEDKVIITEHRLLLTGASFYTDHYRRYPDGAWRIAKTSYIRTYEAMEPLPEGWQLTANLWGTPETTREEAAKR